MIVMLDSSRKEFELAPSELKCPVEQLLTPLTRYNLHSPKGMFAIDNGAFSKFNRKGFESLLEREDDNRERCRFVAVPDVVGSARRTLEVFDYWYPLINRWPLALVAQDGQEDLPICWEFIDAIFIGGSTKWKESDSARDIVKAAKAMDKHVHIGRINTPSRYDAFKEWGADSCDGTGLARYSHMRRAIGGHQPRLIERKEMLVEV